jgi:hypothetical protein
MRRRGERLDAVGDRRARDVEALGQRPGPVVEAGKDV